MKKLDLVKAGAEIIVSIGVGAIVGNAVMFTTPAATKGIMKFCITAGKWALQGLAGDKAAAYVAETIDNSVERIKGWSKEKTPEQEIEETV